MEEKGMELFLEVTNILVLPEDCISKILSFTSPRDTCRSAVVCSKFCSAAKSDVVWQRFLHFGFSETETSLAASSLTFANKKDLFFHLSNGFALEKWNDKIWCMIGPGELCITWHDYDIDDEQFLGYLPDYEPLASRFSDTPHIRKTTGMSIKGRLKLRILSPYTHYTVYFVYVPRFYIFDYHEIKVMVKFIREGVEEELTNYFVDKEVYGHPPRVGFGYVNPRKRDDGWTEVEMGEFFTGDDHHDDEVEVRLWETNRFGNSSNGLFLQGIEFRPKEIV